MTEVKAVQDDSSHWYVIPSKLINIFYDDLDNDDMTDIGVFYDKWGKYRTGGDLNLIKLYAEIE